jgi:hypothetical protein
MGMALEAPEVFVEYQFGHLYLSQEQARVSRARASGSYEEMIGRRSIARPLL